MANLAQARSRAFEKARKEKDVYTRTDTLSDIRAEGFEDANAGDHVNVAGYKGDELAAYGEGWDLAFA